MRQWSVSEQLSIYLPHPPLTHQQSTDNKLGLMMGWGGGGEGMGA